MADLQNILNCKKDLESFSHKDIHLLSRSYGITNSDYNDLLWLLAMQNLDSIKKSKFNMSSAILKDYDMIKQLGQGAYGTVHQMRRKSDGEVVAVKEIYYGSLNATAMTALYSEVFVMQAIKHPGIVKVISNVPDKDNKTLYIIMEYIDGPTLKEYIAAHSLQPSQKFELMKSLAKSLEYLHNNGVVHRDIKDENIMITSDGKPIYIDCGFCCFNDKKNVVGISKCKPSLVGTPLYQSPQSLQVTLESTFVFATYKTADVWALGLVFYTILYSSLPPTINSQTNRRDLNSAIIGGIPPSEFKLFDDNLSNALVRITMGMLKKTVLARSTIGDVVLQFDAIDEQKNFVESNEHSDSDSESESTDFSSSNSFGDYESSPEPRINAHKYNR